LDFGSFSGRKEDRKGFGLRFILRKEGRSERVWTSVQVQEDRKTGKGFGSGRLENRKGLRLRKNGKPERASAQEERKTRKGFGSGRTENQKGLRLRKIERLEEASATDDRRTGKRKLEGPTGGKGASPGSRRRNRCEPVEPEGRKTSIKKDGYRSPVTGGQQQRAENRVKLERPRRICSPPSAEFRYFYGEEAYASSLFFALKILPGSLSPEHAGAKSLYIAYL
jgi:hypothetical protein